MPITPTTKKGRQTRAAILEAAGRVFSRDGYLEARMIDIATEAGLSTGGLYRYFDNKTEVFAALIADIHEKFYELSGRTRRILETDPLAALTEANRGYIEYYYKNRRVMRAFIEAASIEARFRSILRSMRDRHVKRFTTAYRSLFGVDEIDGVRVEIATEAMTCMVEQCCYVWFAQEEECANPPSLQEAIAVTSQAWYAAMFMSQK